MSENKDSKTNKTESEGNGSQKLSYRKKGRRKKRSNSKFESSGNTFKGPIPELKDHYGKDMRATLTKMEVTIITAKSPASHDKETIKTLTPLEAKKWEFDIKEYCIAAKELEDNLGILFDKLWAQCNLGISGNQSKYMPVQIFLSNKKLHNFRQADNQSFTDYHKEFDTLFRMAEQHGNTYSMSDIEKLIIRSLTDPNIKGKSTTELSADIQEVIPENACGVYLATTFIMHANDSKYGAYKQSLYNNYCQGDDRYPKSVVDACTMLDNYEFNLKLYSVKTLVVGHTSLSHRKKEKNEESEGSKSDSSQDDNGA
eukprot:jgi/Psemu1/13508/gm1.13508_g